MSKDLKKLLKQQEALAEQIKQAEQVEKNRNRVERIALKIIGKHPALFTAEPAALEKALEAAFSHVLKELSLIVK
jgi:hypothetical protein